MATIDVGGYKAAEVSPTAGSQGRTQLDLSGIARGLSGFANSAAGFFEVRADGLEAQEGIKNLDNYIRGGESSLGGFEESPEDIAIGNAKASYEGDTGGTMSKGDLDALKSAANTAKRLNGIEASDPQAKLRADIERAKSIRNLIEKRPSLAKEFRGIIYGDKNFVTDLISEETSRAEILAAQNKAAYTKLRGDALDLGITGVLNVADGELATYVNAQPAYQESVALGAMKRRLDAAKGTEEGQQLKTTSGQRRVLAEVIPGIKVAYNTEINKILNRKPAEGELLASFKAQQQKDIDLAGVRITDALAGNFSPAVQQELIGDYFTTTGETFKRLVSAEGEATQAKAQMDFLQSRDVVEFYQRTRAEDVSPADTNFVVKVLGEMSNLGLLGVNEEAKKSGKISKILELTLGIKTGQDVVAPRPTRATPAEAAANAKDALSTVLIGAEKFGQLDETKRALVARLAYQELLSPDNQKEGAGLDKVFEGFAQPAFRVVADSQEFKSLDKAAFDRASQAYLTNLGDSAVKELSSLKGRFKPELGEDKNSLLSFRPDQTVLGSDATKLARLQQKIQNAIKAQAHINNLSYRDASVQFYQNELQ